MSYLGKGQATKTDDFLEKFQRGEGQGVILNPKIHIADFGPLYRALNRDLRKKLQYRFPKMASLHFLLSRNSLKKVQLNRVMRNGRSQLCTKQTEVLFMSYMEPLP